MSAKPSQRIHGLDDDRQNQFGKVKSSIARVWMWLMMLPCVRIALNWHRQREMRITNLQDRCIKKAHSELRSEAKNTGLEYVRDIINYIELLKIRLIPECEKQYHLNYDIAQKLETWKLIQENLQTNLKFTEKTYRTIRSERELQSHLHLPKQPLV